jgi:putative hydrolase of the HAD superfamily
MHRNTDIEILLFDLGGVIIEVDWEKAFNFWSAYSTLSVTEIRNRFPVDFMYDQYERGEVSAQDYFAHLRNVIEYTGSDESLIQGWNSILGREIEETVGVIKALEPDIPVYLLTNTNPTHEVAWREKYPQTIDLFTGVFVSSTLGHRKPERPAFEAVARTVGVNLSSILFFDDSLENIAGARITGLQAVHVTSPSDINRKLVTEFPGRFKRVNVD